MSKEKRRVKIELYVHEKLEEDINQQGIMESEYEGRLLGLIDSKQFSYLLKHKDAQSKFLTTETMDLDEITKNYKEMNGLRIAVAIKKKNGVWADKNLFVSEKLSRCAYTTSHEQGELQAGFSGEKNGWILITEKAV